MPVLYEYVKELLLNYGFLNRLAIYGAALISFLMLFILTLIVFLIIRKIFVKIVGRIVLRTKGIWDDTLFDHRVFHVLTHIVPAIILFSSSGYTGEDIPWFAGMIKGLAHIYLAVIIMTAFIRFLNAAQEIYNTYPYSKDRPIKGYMQLMKILIYFVGAIFIVAILVDKNPASLFAGLGAMAAVFLLVFKDAIMGFVASIQLAANNMLKPGDWITVPRYEVDGTVYDITLTTVKIQNWDKTITTIPTYSLVSESVINWNGMMESGGRRIQRTINIDITTIRLCDDKMVERICKLPEFNRFIHPESTDRDDYQHDTNTNLLKMDLFDKPTNLSMFKKYLEGYIRIHPGIHEKMTRMVRFLQSTDKGLPVEIIVFSKAQQSDLYESLQAEIFDHIFALLPDFDLSAFQSPSGSSLPAKNN
jgi:miniconductance mechanosensitive channel